MFQKSFAVRIDHRASRCSTFLVSSNTGTFVPENTCAHLSITMHFLPILEFALICFTDPHIFWALCFALMWVNPSPPENLVPNMMSLDIVL